MPLSAGTKLGPYEILAPIGAGGMGEVYTDTRLSRRDAAVIDLATVCDREALQVRMHDRILPIVRARQVPDLEA
jgi:hypothetical protein